MLFSSTNPFSVSSQHNLLQHVRAFVTPPDPTKPTSDPAFDSASSQKGGSSNTLLYLVAGTGLAAGAWYYMRTEEDPHAQRKEDEERLKKKAQELKEAGKQTAHDAVREGQNEYQSYKVCAVMWSGRPVMLRMDYRPQGRRKSIKLGHRLPMHGRSWMHTGGQQRKLSPMRRRRLSRSMLMPKAPLPLHTMRLHTGPRTPGRAGVNGSVAGSGMGRSVRMM